MAEDYFGPEPYAQLWNYTGGGIPVYGEPNGPLQSSSPQVQALIDQGLITRTRRQGQNETGTFDITTDAFDPFDPRAQQLPKSTVPTNSFNWMPIGADTSRSSLIDPSLVYHDANYGWLTPSFNAKGNLKDWQDMIGPLVMTAVTLGAGALAGAGTIGATEAGLSAAESGAGAGAAGAGWAGNTITSAPWYLNAGQSAARMIGEAMGNSKGGYAGVAQTDYGIPNDLLTPIQKSTTQITPLVSTPTFNPAAFGNMGSMSNVPAVSDGSQRVATAVTPDAYGNSYNQIIT